LKPIAVTNHSDTIQKSVSGALDKLIVLLDKTVERQRSH
jgi:hypothetical protein